MRHLPIVSVSLVLLAAAATAGTVACSGAAPGGAGQTLPTGPTAYTTQSSNLSRNTSPSVAPADVATLVKDNTDFAFNLYSGVAADETSNLFYSPYSISLALAMAYEGASGETAQQIAKALSWELPTAQLGPAFDALDLGIRTGANARNPGSLSIADSIWGSATMTFAQPFLDTLETDFGAGVAVVDFQNPTAAAKAINGWVASETAQKITNLIDPASITTATQAVLVNAVYFKAHWVTPFAPSATSAATFTRLDGSTVQANEMQGTLGAPYVAGNGYAAVSLGYDNGTSLLVVLPDVGQFTAIEKGLDTAFLQGVMGSMASTTGAQVALSLPKFGIHGGTISVTKELQSLGMVDAFAHGSADFSAMATPRPDHISDVVHQAFVSVDENGTEAAAATAVVFADASVVEAPLPPVVMDVNRPFLFFVVDDATKTVLFAGRDLDPTK